MKKKKVILTGVLALMGVIGYLSLRVNNGEHKFSDLELANIEALANNEAEPLPIPCHSSGKRSTDERYTDCSTCLPVIGYKGKGTEALCKPK